MNIFKGVKNLWVLSSLESKHSTEILPKGDKVVKLIKKNMAKIVDLSPDVDLE